MRALRWAVMRVAGPACTCNGSSSLAERNLAILLANAVKGGITNIRRKRSPESFALGYGATASRPFSILTGLDSSRATPDSRPARVAVRVIAPGFSVERMATRLMPHSVLR